MCGKPTVRVGVVSKFKIKVQVLHKGIHAQKQCTRQPKRNQLLQNTSHDDDSKAGINY
jgi:hypothetical protein